jgi:phage regulator Rha-like protein
LRPFYARHKPFIIPTDREVSRILAPPQLTQEEFAFLKSQFVTSKGRGGRRYLPYAFTEHGVIMAANVLNSERAVQSSVHIVRAFINLRQILLANADLAGKLDELEKKYDAQFKVVFEAIRQGKRQGRRRMRNYEMEMSEAEPLNCREEVSHLLRDFARKPICLRFVRGGVMSCRIASNTTLN